MTRRHFILGVILAASLQSGALAKMVYERINMLKSGEEILLETVFIDPRDLFRGHYTRLDFRISRIDPETVSLPERINYNDQLFLELDTSTGFATVKTVTLDFPKTATGPVIKAKALNSYTKSGDTKSLRVRLPFDRFFAAKERALALEQLKRESRLGVILVLDDQGNGVISGLTIEGKKIYEEPLF